MYFEVRSMRSSLHNQVIVQYFRLWFLLCVICFIKTCTYLRIEPTRPQGSIERSIKQLTFNHLSENYKINQLLHYFVIDTHQLVWVAVVEIEAPVVSRECEVGFPWCFWWPAQSTRQNKALGKRFPFHHHWKRSSVTLQTFCTICTGLPSAQEFYWVETCMSHTHQLQTDLFTNKTHQS